MEIVTIANALQSLFSNNGVRRRETLLNFSTNTFLVARGLRTAFLVDTISLPLESAQELSSRLRNLGDLTEDLMVVREVESEQTFIVNSQSLLSREQDDKARPIVYVGVGGTDPVILSKMEPSLRLLLDHLIEQARNRTAFVSLDLSTILPGKSVAFNRSTLVSLAGYLLEYSLVYSLINEENGSVGTKNCLGYRDLSLVKITLRRSSTAETHPLLAFSFPRSIINGPIEIYEQELVASLRQKFTARLPRQTHWDSIDVTVEGPIQSPGFSL